MRVLMVEPGPNFSVSDVHRGWSKALTSAGCEVVNANFAARLEWYDRATQGMGQETEEGVQLCNESLRATVYDLWPDVIVITSSFYVSPYTLDVFRSRRHKVVLLHTESPYEDDRQIERAQHVDVNVVNDPTNIEAFPPGTLYLPHCYDPDIHHPGPSDSKSDVCIVGTGYPSRVRFLEAVDFGGADVLLAGNWQQLEGTDSPLTPYVLHPLDECYPNELTADLYRGAKTSLNIYRREAERAELEQGWAMGPREVELAACGTFYLTEPRGENREVLRMVPTFDGAEDYSEKLAWFLDHDDERERIATEAQVAVADRTFHTNVRRLLQEIT